MQTRRAVLGALGGLTAALAGCPLLNEPSSQAAEPAAVGDSALDGTGFELKETTDEVLEQTVEAGGESTDLSLTNWVTRYTRPLPRVEADAVRFTLLTTPSVSLAGQSVNPLQQLDEAALVEEMVSRQQTAPVENVEPTGQRTVTVLETEVTFTEFDAETTKNQVALRLYLGDLAHDGDVIVVFGLHPQLVEEAETMYTLAGGVDHPVARPQN
jgi:hypothetical protein